MRKTHVLPTGRCKLNWLNFVEEALREVSRNMRIRFSIVRTQMQDLYLLLFARFRLKTVSEIFLIIDGGCGCIYRYRYGKLSIIRREN